jgi:hypothetical protein
MDEETCARAAENGHLKCLQFAHENGCPWNEETFSYAAKNGHLDCLEFLYEKNCPWDEETCARAAENGHLKCLQFAHENGCPWDKNECLKLAIKNNKNSIINFIENLNEKKDEVADGSLISSTCNICLQNKKCVFYQPCGHVSSCWACSSKMKNCPDCRTKIYGFFKVFFP